MIFLSLFSAFFLFTPTFAVWPRPQNMTIGNSPLRLSSGFSIDTSRIQGIPQDLSDAVTRTTNYLKTDKLGALLPDRGASSAQTIGTAPALQSLTLIFSGGNSNGSSLQNISDDTTAGLGVADENYTLNIPAGGNATLTANSALGLFRGLSTFEQLWFYVNETTYTLYAPIQIQDGPVYPYRGLMLDTARNYIPVDDIKRTLDAMSWIKINHFHWHVVDSQSFPLVVPGFEELSEKGAYSAAQVYTPDNVTDIVTYAAARGIDVVVEFDIPGHSAAIARAHPEHIACPYASPWAQFANEPPAGQLRLASLETINFTASLVKAVSTMLPNKLFSTGGDEINLNCYTNDNQTQTDLKSSGLSLEEALDDFTQVAHAEIHGTGKSAVVWEEMVTEHQVKLRNDTLVMVWKSSNQTLDGSDPVKSVAGKGFRVIHASSDFFYLDCGQGEWIGDDINGNSWCDPFKSWQKAYSFDPVANLTAEEAKSVVGGQQLLWSEQSGHANLDPMLWPRAGSSAELFWSGPGGDVKSALPRLHEVAYRFTQRGVNAIPLQPQYCALNPGKCDRNA